MVCMNNGYNHKNIEKKWQDFWNEQGTYKSDSSSSLPKKYILDMFPYPSGAGLHVGHPKGYIATDILSRMYRMQGLNVLHPMGWDAFGLPAEQFAIKNQIHPKTAVDKNVETYKRQLQMIGLDYDWSREVNTTDPAYYKWTQWAFLHMFKKGLAFESYEPINWCPSCKTGLANEDLEDGKCERCGSVIEQKPLRQWVLRITDYAERMLADLDTLDKWPESVKTSQRNWIGKSEGAEISFPLVVKDGSYIMPEFVDEKNPPVEGKPTKERKTIHAIVYSKERDEYLTLKWKNYDWHTIVVGGVDEDENIIESARREVQEETGYTDLVFKGILGGEVRSQYFAAHKDENRVAVTTALYFELGSENKIEVSEEESIIHNAVWVPRAEFKPEEMTNIELPLWFERIQELEKNTVKVFTTRPDTLFGVTYVVLAPESKFVFDLKDSIQNWSEVQNYIEETKKKSPLDRQKGEKTGVELQGVFAVNPVNNEQIPVWIADYVLANYGTGAVMAVPAHDERDWDFARKNNLNIKPVIAPFAEWETENGVAHVDFHPNMEVDSQNIELFKKSIEHHFNQGNRPITENFGMLVNSGEFNGFESREAGKKIVEKVGGEFKTTYKLQDWVFSRQRYWGEPIPIVHVEGKAYPLAEDQLPLELPQVENYEPSDSGESPLADISEWVNVRGSINNAGEFVVSEDGELEGRRETNTMPQWAGSCWYYLRYIDPNNSEALVDANLEQYFQPVDVYVGGMEHATRHLIYARFWHKFLFDIGVVHTEEPFMELHAPGLILAEDGRKMSKRWGNVVNPDDMVERFGADAFRLYEAFMGPFDDAIAWNTDGLVGTRRFVERVVRISEHLVDEDKEIVTRELHTLIKKISFDIPAFKFNTAVAAMMTFVNLVEKEGGMTKQSFVNFVQILAPFAPHVAEELWYEFGGEDSIHTSAWPQVNESKLIRDTVEVVVQVNGKLRARIEVAFDAVQDDVYARAMQEENVQKFMEGTPKKIIFVPNKILNIVV